MTEQHATPLVDYSTTTHSNLPAPTVTYHPTSPQQPSVGRIVHYVSYGTPGGEYQSVCRAAIVAEVYPGQAPGLLSGGEMDEGQPPVCALAVLNPSGLFFNDCQQDEYDKAAGTWHWPERV